MSLINLGKFGVRFGKRGIKKVLEIHQKSQQNRYITKNFDKGSETDKANMTNKFLKNETVLKKLTKDKDVKKTVKALDKRNKSGKKNPGSYIQKKLKAEELSKFKKGGSVKAKCKLGRNKSTKLY